MKMKIIQNYIEIELKYIIYIYKYINQERREGNQSDLQAINREILQFKEQESNFYQNTIKDTEDDNDLFNKKVKNNKVITKQSVAKEKKSSFKTALGAKLYKILNEDKLKNKYRNSTRKFFEKVYYVVNLINPNEAPEIIRHPLSGKALNSSRCEPNFEFIKKLEKSIYRIKNGISNKKIVLTKVNTNVAGIQNVNNKNITNIKKPVNNDSDDDIFKDMAPKTNKKINIEEKKLTLVSKEEKEDVLKYKDIDIFTFSNIKFIMQIIQVVEYRLIKLINMQYKFNIRKSNKWN